MHISEKNHISQGNKMRVFSIEDALYGMQAVLIGEVPPELRAVAIDLDQDKKLVYVHFYHDGEISEKQKDAWNYAISLRPEWQQKSKIKRLDYPQAIPPYQYFAYLRKEEGGIRHRNNISCRMKVETGFIAPALLAAQNALLGIVTPELRAVVVDFEEKNSFLYIRFYHDKDVPETLIDLWLMAMEQIKEDFAPNYLLDGKVERVDYPKTFPFRGRYAYFRKELPIESHSLKI